MHHRHTLQVMVPSNANRVNSSIAINQFPPEILLLIFRIYSMTEWRGGDVPWIKVTHVCRMWRDIALAAPTLWSYIRIIWSTSLDRVATWLQRSGQAPLIVISLALRRSSYIDKRIAIYQAILEHLPRIQELDVQVPNMELFHPDRFGSSSFPLSHLDVLHSPDFCRTENPVFAPWSQLHVTFPSLASLGLFGFRLDFGSCRLPGSLTSLRLWDSHSAPDTRLDLFLDILRGLPLLTDLRLGRGKLCDTTTSASTSLSTVSLPNLRRLRISENLTPCINLLAHLSIPIGLRYNLTLLMTTESMPLLPSHAQALTTWMSRMDNPWRYVQFTMDRTSREADEDDDEDEDENGIDYFSFTAGGEMKALKESFPSSRVIFEEEDISAEDFWGHSRIDSVFSYLDFSKTTTLSVYMPSWPQSAPMTFMKMVYIEELHIQGNDGLRDDIVAECLSFLDQRQSPESPVIFPRLRTLYLYRLSLNEDDDLIHIQHILLDRIRRTSPIDRLVLAQCKGARPEDFTMVADLVQVSLATEEELKVYTSQYSVDQLAAMEDLRQLLETSG